MLLCVTFLHFLDAVGVITNIGFITNREITVGKIVFGIFLKIVLRNRVAVTD